MKDDNLINSKIFWIIVILIVIFSFGLGIIVYLELSTYDYDCYEDNYKYLCDDNISNYKGVIIEVLLNDVKIRCERIVNYDYRNTGLKPQKEYYYKYLTEEEVNLCRK